MQSTIRFIAHMSEEKLSLKVLFCHLPGDALRGRPRETGKRVVLHDVAELNITSNWHHLCSDRLA